jgi:molecular chaperone GrpE
MSQEEQDILNTEQNEKISETNQEKPATEATENAEGHWPEDETVANADTLLAAEKEKYLRLYSDFENFKKRTARERIEFLSLAGKDIILGMLPVLDDLERALKASEKLTDEAKSSLEGFQLIYKKMLTELESKGLKPMDAVGQKFDVELHEAITKIPAPLEGLKGKVVEEIEKGYLMNEKVIRFAKVIIGE